MTRLGLCLILFLLGACAARPSVEVVTRHDLAAAPEPRWTAIEAGGDLAPDGLRFRALSDAAAEKLKAAGFPPPPEGEAPVLIARLSYEEPVGQIATGYRLRYVRYGFGGWGCAYNAFGQAVLVRTAAPYRWVQEPVSTIVYEHKLDVALRRASDSAPVWEGESRAATRTSTPESALNAALTGLFVDFPGPDGVIRTVTLPKAEDDE